MSTAKTTDFQGRRIGRLLALLALAATAMTCSATASEASAAVEWKATRTQWAPTNLPPGGRGALNIRVANVGDTASTSWPTVTIALPEGVTFSASDPLSGLGWQCSGAGTPQVVTCANPNSGIFELGSPFSPIKPHAYVSTHGSVVIAPIRITVDIGPGAPEGQHPLPITLSGGGAAAPTAQTHEVFVGSSTVGYGFLENSVGVEAVDSAGGDYLQAGGRPHAITTAFSLTTQFNEPAVTGSWEEAVEPTGGLKDVVVDLPVGLVGDPTAVPTCPSVSVLDRDGCPHESQVGVADYGQVALPGLERTALYNIEPEKGTPALLAFGTPVGPVVLKPVVRSDGSWDLRVGVRNLTEANPIYYARAQIWGVPGDPSHDAQRCFLPNSVADACVGYPAVGQNSEPDSGLPHTTTAPRLPFLSNPTECDGQPEITEFHISDWNDPAPYEADGDPDLSSDKWKSASEESPPIEGCEALEFAPSLKARPTTNLADSPSGLDVDLHVPQSEDPDGLATSHLRDATVTLPEGLVINPSGANGLGACAPAQIGLTSAVGDPDASFTREPDNCPDSAKIGTVSVDTPLLEDPIPGAVYVTSPFQNPFSSLLAIYISLNDPESGIVGKLAGKVQADPQTGRLTTTFKESPQVPFEDFHLDFFGGAAAALKTPPACGNYSTTSELTPWSAPHTGPAATPRDDWAITQGPNGTPCSGSEAELPNSPSFESGSASPIAGAHSPFVVNLSRDDGTQRFSKVTVTPPPGLFAKLAGTTYCPEEALATAATRSGKAEQSSPSCPASSRVGSVVAGAGAGPAPYYATGTAYLSGPHKGAPLSLAIVTPAVAGPFDLGTIVVRTALHLDPRSAQITAVSDEIPQILEGIPLDVRSISVRLDRPQFALNPTSCDPMAVAGQLTSTLGQTAALQNRFQLGECGRLGFKPRLNLRLFGKTNRGAYQGLRAVLRARPGDANIARTVVRMPKTAFVAQEHLSNICTRVQFAAGQCPEGSVYGKVVARSPLLDYPVSGNVYLRSSDNPLPDLVADLRGPVHQPLRLELVGRTDSIRGALRNTFDLVPDAPVSYFRLQLFGGNKGLIRNSANICAGKQRAAVLMDAHNGRRLQLRPQLRNSRCAKQRKAGREEPVAGQG